MKNRFLLLLLPLLLVLEVHSQKFWLLTYEFPGGPKTSITGVKDTALIVGLTHGVMRSFNEGNSWETTLQSSFIHTVHATDEGLVLAGGDGKIFVSPDYGSTWDSLDLGHTYAITRFAHFDNELWAISGTLDNDLGFVGAGVYYSNNQGLSWTQRNNGLGAFLACSQIALDQYGRLYLTVFDEYETGLGGLYISDNGGQLWKYVNIEVFGAGVIENQVRMLYATGLSISPQDTVYISGTGAAGAAGVRLNLSKSIHDLEQPNFWQRTQLLSGPTWWFDRLLNSIHFAQNGDRYSSISGSWQLGGTFFSKHQTYQWKQQKQGLGLDVTDNFNVQEFYEISTGKVFMVQRYDERIYWADTSALVSSAPEDLFPEDMGVVVYPNPASGNTDLLIAFEQGSGMEKFVWLHDAGGRVVEQISTAHEKVSLVTPVVPGVYALRVDIQGKTYWKKLVVL